MHTAPIKHPRDVSVEQATTWLASTDPPVVIDVRTPTEFGGGRIAGAHNVPLDLVENETSEVGDLLASLGRDVLLVCQNDPRAHKAASVLAQFLGERGHVLTGGMSAWSRQDAPSEGGDSGVWPMERQVRTAAGAIALTGILASTAAPKAKWLAGGVGAGLLYSGVSGTCTMAHVLGAMPWNRTQDSPTLASVTNKIKEN